MNSLSARLSCAVVTDLSGLDELEPEWTALYQAASGAYLSDSFEWAKLAWEKVCRPRRRQLFCIVVRRLAGVAAILPLVVSRRGPWRVATPLNSEGSEYCPFLIHPDVSAEEVMQAILDKLESHGELHALYLPYVRNDEPLGLWLARRGAVRVLSLPAARASFDGCPDWDSYFARRSSHMRQELRRKLRAAERLGAFEMYEVVDPEERQEVWRWLVDRKRQALARRAKNDWLLSRRHAGFTAASIAELGGRRPMFAVKLDGKVIAAGLCSAGTRCVEGFVMSYDESFSRISPGVLLQIHCARWALERGLAFDLRTGHEAFKSQWADQFSEVSTYLLALNRWGRAYVAVERTRRWFAGLVPQSLRGRVRRKLEAVTTRLAPSPRAAVSSGTRAPS